MKTYSTILSQYSLAAVDIGKPIGEPSVTKFNSGKKALLALHAAIKGNSKFQVFLIGTPDGREIPFDQAYFEVFGERPVFRDGVANGYPRLK